MNVYQFSGARLAALFLLVSLVPACATAIGFTDTAFVPLHQHFRIDYADGAAQAVLSDAWRPENFRRDGGGTYRENAPGQFPVEYAFDTDGDGDLDRRITRPLYDLRLAHRGDGSLIFARSIPLGREFAERTLQNLAHTYVESVTGTTYVGVRFDEAVSNTHAARIVSEQQVELDGRRAIDVTFDIIDLAQREVNPDAVERRVRLVLARPDSRFRYRASSYVRVPMVVALVYSARPEEFAAHAADFDGFLTRFRWAQESP